MQETAVYSKGSSLELNTDYVTANQDFQGKTRSQAVLRNLKHANKNLCILQRCLSRVT